jgi:hypothetical protein
VQRLRAVARLACRPARLDLERVVPVAGERVREDEREWSVLELPDVTELVGDELVGDGDRTQEDQPR